MEDNKDTVRDFEAKSAVGIFGAPISWVALVAALIGAMSIVPFLFYPLGGGFLSAGIGIFGPVGGILLGPWAGFVAGFIGGLIGMVISPAAYPLGLVDVTLSGAFVPLAWGLMQPRYRKIVVWAFPLVLVAASIIPYHWPGAAIGLGGVKEPANILQWSHGWLGMLLFWFLAPRIWKLYDSESQTKSLIGFALNMFMATVLWMTVWVFPWYMIIRLPFDVAVANSWANWWVTAIPMTLTSAVIGFFLIRAIRRGNLRRIPGSYLTFGEK
jgi:hypothetical protein